MKSPDNGKTVPIGHLLSPNEACSTRIRLKGVPWQSPKTQAFLKIVHFFSHTDCRALLLKITLAQPSSEKLSPAADRNKHRNTVGHYTECERTWKTYP